MPLSWLQSMQWQASARKYWDVLPGLRILSSNADVKIPKSQPYYISTWFSSEKATDYLIYIAFEHLVETEKRFVHIFGGTREKLESDSDLRKERAKMALKSTELLLGLLCS